MTDTETNTSTAVLTAAEYGAIDAFIHELSWVGDTNHEVVAKTLLSIASGNSTEKMNNTDIIEVCNSRFSSNYSNLFEFIKENSSAVRTARISGEKQTTGYVEVEMEDDQSIGDIDWDSLADDDNNWGGTSDPYFSPNEDAEITTNIVMNNYNYYCNKHSAQDDA